MGLFTRKKKSVKPVCEFRILNGIKVPLVPFGYNITKSDVVMIYIDRVVKTITKEIKNERVRDLRFIQEELTNSRNEMLAMYKKKNNGSVTISEYNEAYARLSKRILELEEEEKEITNVNMLIQIEEEKMKKIMEILDNKETNLTYYYVIRTLIDKIKEIDEKTLEFQFTCGINITERI